MQDYRNEVKEFFSSDEQLAAEVEFALKAAEKQREMEEQMDNCSLTGDGKTPTAQVPTHNNNTNAKEISFFISNFGFYCCYIDYREIILVSSVLAQIYHSAAHCQMFRRDPLNESWWFWSLCSVRSRAPPSARSPSSLPTSPRRSRRSRTDC